MTPRGLLLGAFGLALLAAAPAHAQAPADSAALPDSIAAGRAPTPTPESPESREAARDRDRFELGAAVVSGPFDALGTFGYHRILGRTDPFETWMHIELSAGSASYLSEGAASVGFLIRPTRLIRRGWPIRPIVEFGPAAHLVVQTADIRGFGETAFHSHVYLKTHGYAGFDIPFASHMGLVVRGRLTIPTHHPFDYAQIALFLR
ncbi:MAG TPA: hypothetical protein VK123_04635 [Candidatus Limnocylindrales bacterium]|nr:hypothetical protein [Candidatus Limnocylindrales bacterium]